MMVNNDVMLLFYMCTYIYYDQAAAKYIQIMMAPEMHIPTVVVAVVMVVVVGQ